ncbi:hypothetical protein [Agarivorans gilvus]|uniref:DUF2157 domain-containing protein n=1 Tax=Agarivorans gilvus TaxID=680279 RepID=A0ABQ1I628_9ALTE|nr:hypothetical protein [Agarivorans gilvus]GGB15751.1 hypothetical protein GCM10007414_31530 [Agarivorans gilvus]
MKQVDQLWAEGLNKQQIYQHAEQQQWNLRKVTKALAAIPETKALQTNAKLKAFLLALLQLLVLSKWGFGFMLAEQIDSNLLISLLLPSLLPLLIMLMIYKNKVNGYLLLMVFAGYSLYQGLPYMFYLEGLVNLAASALLLALGCYLKKRLFPFQNLFHNAISHRGHYIFQKVESEASKDE